MDIDTLATPESAPVTIISNIKRKMHFTGSVVKATLAGAIVDIGLDIPGVVHISQLRKEPVNKVEDVVQVGQNVDVWIRHVDQNKRRIELTMIEPLPLEWREITKGIVVKGKVIRLEKFGAFVDIGAERPGLIHVSELTHSYIRNPSEVVKEGDEVEVKVLAVDRRKKKIRLSMKALEEKPAKPAKTKDKGKEAPQESAEKGAPGPTAMEIALREAMERAKSKRAGAEKKRKQKGSFSDSEIEKILSRTLDHKLKTSSK